MQEGQGAGAQQTPGEPHPQVSRPTCVHRGQTGGAGVAVRTREPQPLGGGQAGPGSNSQEEGWPSFLQCPCQGLAFDGNTSFARDKETEMRRGPPGYPGIDNPSAPAEAPPLPHPAPCGHWEGAAGRQRDQRDPGCGPGPHSPPC